MTKNISILDEIDELNNSFTPDENKMGTAPIGKLLLSMSWPAVLSMTIGALYNIVDSIFVSMINADALAAVSIIMPMQSLIIAVGVGSGIGVNSLIARRLGAGNQKEADIAASTSVKIAIFNYIIFLIVGTFFSETFIRYFSSDSKIVGYGTTYMKIICCLSVFFLMQLALEKVLQATGNMIVPMIMAISGALVNLALDPVFIFGLFGMPKLGVSGAAIATIIGQSVAATIAVLTIIKKEHQVTITWFSLNFDWKIIKEIYDVGFPSMIMQALFSFMLIGYNWIISVSSAAIAVLGIYAKLQTLVFMPVFGVVQGAMPIMGYNFGAKKKERLMKVYKLTIIVALIIMIMGTILFVGFPKLLLNFFNSNEKMVEIGVPALRIAALSFIPASFGIMSSTMFQASGHGFYSLMGSLIRQCLVVLPFAYFLYNVFGIKACWYSLPLGEIIGLVYFILMMKYLYDKEIKYL